jgi:hypothetical protein
MLGCDSFRRLMSRRDALWVGGASLFGLTLGDFFRAEATPARRQARARQVVMLFLRGGPPHQDLFDMKPDRPQEVRGPFRPIRTVVPGLDVCEHLPRTARVADKFTILRSVHSRGYPEAGGHHAGLSWKTGNPRGLRGTPKYPAYGSVTARLLPTPTGLPAYVALGDLNAHAPGVSENYLGPAYDPLSIPDDRRADVTLPMLTPSVAVTQLNRSAELVRQLDELNGLNDSQSELISGLGHHQQRAFDLLRSPRLREALSLDREPSRNRERYGCTLPYIMNRYARSNFDCEKVLLARRLVEAGVPFVYVDFGYWDWHNGNGLDRATPHLASFDHAIPALLTDLEDRGLLETTLVLAFGEMGRTPRANMARYGREHWAPAQFVLMAGGGVRPGQVVGATDRDAAYVRDREYRIGSLGKTIYHLLGLDPDHELSGADERPLKLITEDVPLIREALA